MSNEERQQNEPVIRLGISTCLLGERVRYDGGHKLDRFLVQTLGRYVEWVAVCPEVEMGLPVPRESMRLEGDPADPRLVASRSGTDHTEAMKAWAQCRVDELAGAGLHGFVLKKDSPSSGLFRVKVYNEHGMAERNGMGMFPRALKERFPLLPMEEEGRLNDMPLRENFIERVFAYQRWSQMLDEEPTPGGLVPGLPAVAARTGKFHTAHKLTLMAHPGLSVQGRQPSSLPGDGPAGRQSRVRAVGGDGAGLRRAVDGGPERARHAGQARERT